MRPLAPLSSAGSALRFVRRRPVWALGVCLILALGIGAGTALFSVVDAVLLRPLPLPDSERLVVVWETPPQPDDDLSRVSPRTFVDWQESGLFAGLAALARSSHVRVAEGDVRRLPGMEVTPGWFEVLHVSPTLGRDFTAAEGQPGAEPVAVISHGFWQRELGGAPDVVGRRLDLAEGPRTIVGVLPANFEFPEPVEIWTPLAFEPRLLTDTARGARYLRVLGRLRDDLEVSTTELGLAELHGRLERQAPLLEGWRARVVPLQEHLVAEERPALLLLFVAALGILAIGCANVAHLLLTTTLARRRELAVRSTLGAGPGRLAGQLVSEGIVLSLAGGALGCLIASWLVELTVHLMPWNLPRLESVTVDGRALLFALLVSLGTGVVVAAAPAVFAGRMPPLRGLRSAGLAGGPPHRSRLQQGLVAIQVAIALVLLVGGGLLFRSLVLLENRDPGFDLQPVHSFFLNLPETRYPDESRRRQAISELLAELGELAPAAVGTNLPISGSNMTFGFEVVGGETLGGEATQEPRFAEYHAVSPGYFRVLGIPLLAGRAFRAEDDERGQPVALVNREFAARVFPGVDPVGRRLVVQNSDTEREIVGMVDDVRHFGLDQGAVPEVYVPFAQEPWPFFHTVVRAGREGPAVAERLRSAVWRVDPHLPVDQVATLERKVSQTLVPRTFQTRLVTIFALLALVLMASGLYAVLSSALQQRLQEVGIRMSLGARRESILAIFLRQGLVLTACGVAAGLGVIWLLAPTLEAHLFEVRPTDPLVLAVLTGLLGLIALCASLVPALRAARKDPAALLRHR